MSAAKALAEEAFAFYRASEERAQEGEAAMRAWLTGVEGDTK